MLHACLSSVKIYSCEYISTRTSKWVLARVNMADVLTGAYFDVCKSYAKCDFRERINLDCKSNVMSTPLDPYFWTCLVSLKSIRDNISSTVQIWRMEGRKTTCNTVRKWISARTTRPERQASKWPSTENSAWDRRSSEQAARRWRTVFCFQFLVSRKYA